MTAIRKQFQIFAASLLLAAVPLGGAWAQTVDEAVQRLKEQVEEQGAKIEWESVDISGSDAVLVGVEVGTDEAMVPIGNVVLNGISRVDNGYRIEGIELDYYHFEDGEGAVTIEGVAMSGVLLPDEDAQDAYGGFMFYETADIGGITVNVRGTDVFTLSDLHGEFTAPENGNPMEFTGAAEGFTLDLSIIEDPSQIAVLQALGYEQLEGYIEVAGSWQPEDGRMALSQYDLTVVDAGTLGFTFDLGGYTPSFIASLRELQKQMAENPEDDNSSQGLAMLGLLQQLSFHGAEIAFTDDSLTGKVLEFVAQAQGMKPADVANQAKAVLPFALAQLNNPDLTAQATQAVAAFLDDPQSLRITAAPAAPVPFALIMAGAMSTPQDLTRTLAVSVSAND